MPIVDEGQQSRDTFGDAPGWAPTQRVAPSSEGVPGASPAPDVDAASSAEAVEQTPSQVQPSEPTPPSPSQAEPTDVPFGKHPRWIERQQELERVRQERDEAQRLARLAVEKLQPPSAPAAPVEDPWAGLVNHHDPATAQFYQQQQRLFQHEARRIAEQQGQSVLQAVDAGRRELAVLKIAQFRRDNPEIQPGSAEEAQIAGLVQQGFDLDTAKKLTLYDRLDAENRALKTKQASVPQKRAAALSEASAGIPQTAGMPPKPGNWRERVSEVLDQGGSFTDAANAIFGGPRR